MDLILVLCNAAVVVLVLRRVEVRQRVRLLSEYLRPLSVELHMKQLTEGYLRALNEGDPRRAEALWRQLTAIEEVLRDELQKLAHALQGVWGERLRVSRWPVGLPQATRFFPQASFDFRALVALHAQSFADALGNAGGLPQRERAFRATAELLLFQHSCHWFCRSKNVASARLLALHRTHYRQVLDAVSPTTRDAYERLIRGA